MKSRVEYQREWKARNVSHQRAYHREYRKRLRLMALTHYSKGVPHCACCGMDRVEFLGIDHINGGGTQHHKKLGGGNMPQWLHANNYPMGFRVLCHNCNFAIGHYGYCPHTKEK